MTIYWTCTRESDDALRTPYEHRRVNATEGSMVVAQQMWHIWQSLCQRRHARQAVVVRIWEDRRLIGEWDVSNSLRYPRPAVHVLAQVRERHRKALAELEQLSA